MQLLDFGVQGIQIALICVVRLEHRHHRSTTGRKNESAKIAYQQVVGDIHAQQSLYRIARAFVGIYKTYLLAYILHPDETVDGNIIFPKRDMLTCP